MRKKNNNIPAKIVLWISCLTILCLMIASTACQRGEESNAVLDNGTEQVLVTPTEQVVVIETDATAVSAEQPNELTPTEAIPLPTAEPDFYYDGFTDVTMLTVDQPLMPLERNIQTVTSASSPSFPQPLLSVQAEDVWLFTDDVGETPLRLSGLRSGDRPFTFARPMLSTDQSWLAIENHLLLNMSNCEQVQLDTTANLQSLSPQGHYFLSITPNKEGSEILIEHLGINENNAQLLVPNIELARLYSPYNNNYITLDFWSPSERYVALIVDDLQEGVRSIDTGRLWLYDLAAGEANILDVPFTDFVATERAGVPLLRWSPDSRWTILLYQGGVRPVDPPFSDFSSMEIVAADSLTAIEFPYVLWQASLPVWIGNDQFALIRQEFAQTVIDLWQVSETEGLQPDQRYVLQLDASRFEVVKESLSFFEDKLYFTGTIVPETIEGGETASANIQTVFEFDLVSEQLRQINTADFYKPIINLPQSPDYWNTHVWSPDHSHMLYIASSPFARITEGKDPQYIYYFDVQDSSPMVDLTLDSAISEGFPYATLPGSVAWLPEDLDLSCLLDLAD